MKLLNVEIAQSFWYGPIRDFNPRGIAWFSVVVPWLINLYKFKIIPQHDMAEKPEQGLKFQKGEFAYTESDLPISVNFTIYPGGVSAETAFSTDACDVFLATLFTRLNEQFKMPPFPDIIRERKYFSQLWFSTEKSLNVLNPKLQAITEFLSNNVQHSEALNFEIGGMSVWSDQQTKYPPPPFLIERAAGIPFAENRYLSRAPLETDKHLELLNMLEVILS